MSYISCEMKIISGLECREPIRVVPAPAVSGNGRKTKTSLRDLNDNVLFRNKWARSINPAERFVANEIESLGYDDLLQTKICNHLILNNNFREIRKKCKQLSDSEINKIILLIKQTASGLQSKLKIKNRVCELLLPIGKAFFSLKSSHIVPISLFVQLLVDYVTLNKIPEFQPLRHRSEAQLSKYLKPTLNKGSYRTSKSGKGAHSLVNDFLKAEFLHFLPSK